jgi:hypothetical protein
MKALHMITFLLVIIWALNWWLVGIFQLDLVVYLLWDMTLATQIVYGLVWMAAIIEIIMHPGSCKMCK